MHEEVEKPFEWFVSNYGNARLTLILNIGFVLASLTLASLIIRRLLNKGIDPTLKWMGLLVLVLSLIGYKWLMPYKSEGAHLVQYAIMGYLSILGLKNAWSALNFSYLLGIIDEAYQFIFGNSVYFDFNDILLNLLGSVIGILVFLYLTKRPVEKEQNLHSKQTWFFYFTILSLVLICLTLYVLSILCIFPEDGCQFALHRWGRESWPPIFIRCTNFGTCWHRVTELEGVFLTPLLPLSFYRLIHYRSYQ